MSRSYPGTKTQAGVHQWLINLMPAHETYIEPFAGHVAIMLRKLPARLNIAIEIDEQTWDDATNKLTLPERRVMRWLGYGEIETYERAAFHTVNADGIAWLDGNRRAMGRETLIYCDPPYLIDTRRSRRKLYRHEMDEASHSVFLKTICDLRCRVIVTHYDHPLYRNTLHRWHHSQFRTNTHRGPAVEHAWCNYNPDTLPRHDLRFVGANFRERERISRRIQRWENRLRTMKPAERQALLWALNNIEGDATR